MIREGDLIDFGHVIGNCAGVDVGHVIGHGAEDDAGHLIE